MLKLSLLIVSLTALPAMAQYHDLIATEDGSTVYFQAATGINTSGWFQAQQLAGAPVTSSLADINADGSTKASSFNSARHCGFAGSTCFLQPDCRAGFSVAGVGGDWSNSNRTFIRLDHTGNFAWIAQTSGCPSLSERELAPTLNGIYDLRTRQLLAPIGDTQLANQRIGRRAITDTGRALVLTGFQLNWLGATGLQRIRHTDRAFEAVTDRTGANVVYNEKDGGTLHWIANNQDDTLPFKGSAPALTPDGKKLVFLDLQETPQAYTRQTGAVQAMSEGPAASFTVGGNFVFAVSKQGQIIRGDLTEGSQTLWLGPSPEIYSLYANSSTDLVSCIIVCYGTPEPGYFLSSSMFVLVKGRFLNRTGMTATLKGVDTPVYPLSETSAWFQVPSLDPSFTTRLVQISDSKALVPFMTAVAMSSNVVCLATVHQDFSRTVTKADPASLGEVVHVYATGIRLAGVIPDGTRNPTDHAVPLSDPPTLFDPAYAELLFAGLAPGLIGIEQLDLRVKAVPDPAGYPRAFGCDLIPVTVP